MTLLAEKALHTLDLACVFKALSDPMRLKILQHLTRVCCEAQVCACDLETLTGLTQPTVSHHMKCLIAAGLVVAEKDGRWVNYTLNASTVEAAIALLSGFKTSP